MAPLVHLKREIEALRFGVHSAWLTSPSYFVPSYAEYAKSWVVYQNPFMFNWSHFQETNIHHRFYLQHVLECFRASYPFNLPNLNDEFLLYKFRRFVARLEVLWNYCVVTHK